MKNKKSLLSLGLLALILVLGVGYAVVSAVGFTFNGTATVADSEINVTISAVDDDATHATVDHNNFQAGDEQAKFTITGMALNETVKVTYTVTNNEADVKAKLAEKVALTNTNPDFFTVDYDIVDAELDPKESTEVVVTVTLHQTPINSNDASTSIAFELEAQPNGNFNN